MQKISQKVFTRQIDTSYDTYNTEISNIINQEGFVGVKTEISKVISPNVQISHLSVKSEKYILNQIFCNLGTNNALLQLSTDQDKNTQVRGTCLFKNTTLKFNTVIGKNREIFSQLEFDLKNKFNNFCYKIIQPAVKDSSPIHICNYMQKLWRAEIGSEIVRVGEYLGLSFVSRIETNKSVATLSLQQFNTISMDYYYKYCEMIDCGVKFSMSQDNRPEFLTGFRVRSLKGEVVGSIDTHKNLTLNYTDKLTDSLTVSASFQMKHGSVNYGYGFSYDF